MSKLEKAGQRHMIASIGKEVGRADYTLFFAKKSWLEKNPETRAEMDQRDRARPGLDEDREREGRRGSRSRRSFPASRIEDNVARREPLPHRRARRSGPTSTEVDPAGLAKAQEIMVVGGVLPADKKVDYDDDRHQRSTPTRRSSGSRANEEALMLAPSGRRRRQCVLGT